VYKRQIYQIAESNRKNRFGSENRIETFFSPNWNALASTQRYRRKRTEQRATYAQNNLMKFELVVYRDADRETRAHGERDISGGFPVLYLKHLNVG